MAAWDEWTLALPLPDTEAVVSSMIEAFNELTSAQPNDFAFSLQEPKITKRLVVHLQTRSPQFGLVGLWDFETPTDTVRLDDPRRLDIRWSTVYHDQYLVKLVFECKKLTMPPDKRHKRWVREYVKEGIHRFVSGSYSPESSIGFMVGFAPSQSMNVFDPVKRSLSQGAWEIELNMARYESLLWRSPPDRFSAQAEFETRHLRDPELPDIVLYHLCLPFA